MAQKKLDHDKREDPGPGVDHDRDVDTRAILRFALVLAVGLAAVLGGAVPLTRWLKDREGEGANAPAPMSTELSRVPPDPRLQPNPRVQLHELRAYESERLGSYGWVDRDAGVAHLPIERAMQLVAERGLPVRPESDRPRDPDVAMPTESSLGVPARERGEAEHHAPEHHAPEGGGGER